MTIDTDAAMNKSGLVFRSTDLVGGQGSENTRLATSHPTQLVPQLGGLARSVSFDNDEPCPSLVDESCLATQPHAANASKTVTTILPSANYEANLHKASAVTLVDRSVQLKEEFIQSGLQISDEKVCEIAMAEIQHFETMAFQAIQEHRRNAIQECHRAEDSQRSERHHQEKMHVAKEDKEWHGKLQQARDRIYCRLVNDFFHTILAGVIVGLFFRFKQLYQDGFWGTLRNSHYYMIQQCGSVATTGIASNWSTAVSVATTMNTTDNATPKDLSWSETLYVPLAGVTSFFIEKAADVTSYATTALTPDWVTRANVFVADLATSFTFAPCYVWQVMGYLMVACMACVALRLTKDWNPTFRLILLAISAFVASGLPWLFVGATALLFAVLMLLASHSYRGFVGKHVAAQTTPTAPDLACVMVLLEDYAGLGGILPLFGVIFYTMYKTLMG